MNMPWREHRRQLLRRRQWRTTKPGNVTVKMNTSRPQLNTIEITSMKCVRLLLLSERSSVRSIISSWKCVLLEHWKRRKATWSNRSKKTVHVYSEQCVSDRTTIETDPHQVLFFRFTADQVFGDEEMHTTVRQNCMDYIVSDLRRRTA